MSTDRQCNQYLYKKLGELTALDPYHVSDTKKPGRQTRLYRFQFMLDSAEREMIAAFAFILAR